MLSIIKNISIKESCYITIFHLYKNVVELSFYYYILCVIIIVDPFCSITKLQNDVYIMLNKHTFMSCKIMYIIKIHDTF